jgi:hypothetical protein
MNHMKALRYLTHVQVEIPMVAVMSQRTAGESAIKEVCLRWLFI